MEASWSQPPHKGVGSIPRRGKNTTLRQEINQEVVLWKRVGLSHYIKAWEASREEGKPPPCERKLIKRWYYGSKLVFGGKCWWEWKRNAGVRYPLATGN